MSRLGIGFKRKASESESPAVHRLLMAYPQGSMHFFNRIKIWILVLFGMNTKDLDWGVQDDNVRAIAENYSANDTPKKAGSLSYWWNGFLVVFSLEKDIMY